MASPDEIYPETPLAIKTIVLQWLHATLSCRAMFPSEVVIAASAESLAALLGHFSSCSFPPHAIKQNCLSRSPAIGQHTILCARFALRGHQTVKIRLVRSTFRSGNHLQNPEDFGA
jgi:hypothetical protein